MIATEYRGATAAQPDSTQAAHGNATQGVAAPSRPGLPVDPRRVGRTIWASRKWILGITAGFALVGAITGKFVVSKTYASSGTLLWEPAAAAKADAVREIATMAQSVKLPANLRAIRVKYAEPSTLESLAKAIEVKPGENSMLLTVTAKAKSKETSRALAQATVDVFLESQRAKAQAKLQIVVDALRQSLAQAEVAQAEARSKYTEFRRFNHVEDFPLEVQTAIQEVARLRSAAKDTEVEVKSLEAKVHALRESQLQSPERVVLSQQEQLDDEVKKGQLETELAQLRAKLTDEHPKVRSTVAELDALKEHSKTTTPTIAAQVVGRSAIHDSLALSVEESSALRKSYTERAKTLATLKQQAEDRASSLTQVEGEAARLLADVKAHEDHVTLLLKQLAMAEDDVRAATSGFQVVSNPAEPEHSEKGIGRVIAAAVPLVGMVLTILFFVLRDLKNLKAKAPNEMAFWTNSPVLAVVGDNDKVYDSGLRNLVEIVEKKPGVIGWTTLGTAAGMAEPLVEQMVKRLRRRGFDAGEIAAKDVPARVVAKTLPLEERLESIAFGTWLGKQAQPYEHLSVQLPTCEDTNVIRAAARWLDSIFVVVKAGEYSVLELSRLKTRLGLEGLGLGLIIVDSQGEIQETVDSIGDTKTIWKQSLRKTENTAKKQPKAEGKPVRNRAKKAA